MLLWLMHQMLNFLLYGTIHDIKVEYSIGKWSDMFFHSLQIEAYIYKFQENEAFSVLFFFFYSFSLKINFYKVIRIYDKS